MAVCGNRVKADAHRAKTGQLDRSQGGLLEKVSLLVMEFIAANVPIALSWV